jgi:hypothetical protein
VPGRNNPGGPETRSFTASGLTKITLPQGCTAETDTHIFAAADDGFSRSENDYTISYVWPFDPSTLTPGLDTKKFSDILKRNLTRLANNTRHNIPLEIALQAVGGSHGWSANGFERSVRRTPLHHGASDDDKHCSYP